MNEGVETPWRHARRNSARARCILGEGTVCGEQSRFAREIQQQLRPGGEQDVGDEGNVDENGGEDAGNLDAEKRELRITSVWRKIDERKREGGSNGPTRIQVDFLCWGGFREAFRSQIPRQGYL